MKDKKRDLLFIVVFLCVLYAPTILYVVIPKQDVENTENRKLASFPTFKSLSAFPSSFEKFYNDNLPFRFFLTSSWANINYLLFKTSINADAVVGKANTNEKDRWLFYNRKSDYDPLGDVSGMKKYSDSDLESIKEKIVDNTKKLKKDGIDLYYLLIPNKSSVYTEYLPDNIGFISEPRNDILTRYLADNKINNFVNTKNALIEAKKNYPTYFMTDTHWNSYGAYIGVMELLKLIEKNDKYYCNNECSNPVIEMKSVTKLQIHSMDLKKILGTSLELRDNEVFVRFLNNTAVNPEVTEYKKNGILIYHNEDALNKRTIVFIGDSFKEGTYAHLPKVFSEVIYVHVEDYDGSLINKYSPDIVVFETVERYSLKRLMIEL